MGWKAQFGAKGWYRVWWYFFKPPVTITNSIDMNFELIQAGSFTIGSQISPEEVVKRYGGKAEYYKDLYDMHGNVYEWCQDWHGNYPSVRVVDPVGHAERKRRVMRGGSWEDIATVLRCAYRHQGLPHARYESIGFRVARDF